MKCAIEMDSGGMIYMPSFIKIGKGVEATLRVHLGNFRDCNVGITNGVYEVCC
jgi:hypothetical protein